MTASRLKPTDPQRIIRALEVFEATGRGLAELQLEAGGPALPALAEATRIALVPDRGWLTERIARRARQMLTEGGIEEVTTLVSLGLAAVLPVMKAIGVAEIGAFSTDEAQSRTPRWRLSSRPGTTPSGRRPGSGVRCEIGPWSIRRKWNRRHSRAVSDRAGHPSPPQSSIHPH